MVYGIYMVCIMYRYPPYALRSIYGVWHGWRECDEFITRKQPLHIDPYITIYYNFQNTKMVKNPKTTKKEFLKKFAHRPNIFGYTLLSTICIIKPLK